MEGWAGARRLSERYPVITDLREAARKRIPRFAFEYIDGGAGADGGIRRNWSALDEVVLLPRYGSGLITGSCEVSLFGRSYACPIGVAPMGAAGVTWPGSERVLAKAAQSAGIPYVLSTVAGLSIEDAAALAPDVFWFQLYRLSGQDLSDTVDLVRRASAAGAHVLVATLDAGVRSVRPREVRGGMRVPFRPTPRAILDILSRPQWLAALARHGIPRFASVQGYAGPASGFTEVLTYVQRALSGTFDWEQLSRLRDLWKGPMVVKGILHPEDAERALSIGMDGVVVSNHGGRQSEALPASATMLPAVVARAGDRMCVMMDSGVRSGTDVVRALALGAKMIFAGKAFLWALAALGEKGPEHAIAIFRSEIANTLGQVGARTVAEAADAETAVPSLNSSQ